MKSFLARLLGYIGVKILKLSELICLSSSKEGKPTANEMTPHQAWLKDNGDKSLRLNYDLNENDVVLDVGGYEGQWASDIFSKYQCKIYIFEPVPDFFAAISKRFSQNKRIHVLNFGLSSSNSIINISVDGDASSSIRLNQETTKVQLRSFESWFKDQKLEVIALMKINIEGGEYDLLNHIIETGLIHKITNIQVQFHDFFPEAESRMLNLQSRLSKTHYPTYQYNFIWENWALKE
ncbi:FkbM family methyltransferase [Methylophilus sp. 13]|uniref:FkbM family methyltransferase n=1 Tax=Methylophilus sp. 13 TaxID=2781018 RepID=UPI00188ECEF7|nr:FkbM family methyltransferase [Methylophilus sp. 13]MBF5038118.1 FkbM family methyltransferase [Methylophilus sp. 13]